MTNNFNNMHKEPIIRSNTVKGIAITIIVLSVIGSIALGQIFRVPITSSRYNYYSSATSDFNAMLMFYGFVVTFFEGFIWYCVYSHIRCQEEQREYLRQIYSILAANSAKANNQDTSSTDEKTGEKTDEKTDALPDNTAEAPATTDASHKNPLVTYLEQRNNNA